MAAWGFLSDYAGHYSYNAHYSCTNGSYVECTFTGTSIKWIGSKNSNHGYADVYIDGELDTENLDTYASSWLKQQVLYTKTGLTNEEHTIKIVVKNQKRSASTNYYQDADCSNIQSKQDCQKGNSFEKYGMCPLLTGITRSFLLDAPPCFHIVIAMPGR